MVIDPARTGVDCPWFVVKTCVPTVTVLTSLSMERKLSKLSKYLT
jgi:hypothetical protein